MFTLLLCFTDGDLQVSTTCAGHWQLAQRGSLVVQELQVALHDKPTCAEKSVFRKQWDPGTACWAAQQNCSHGQSQSAAGKSQQVHPALKVREWNVGTCTFTWYLLVCHPDPGALWRCLYSAITKAGAGRGRWAQKLSCFFVENTVQHTVRCARRSHPVHAPAHS